jgi:Type II secretion system (T2SS), protein E, N-terminal domain
VSSLARKKLGDLLVESGVLDRLQLSSALGFQKQWGGRIGRICVELKFTDERTITDTVARQLGIPVVELAGRMIPPQVIAAVPQELCERFQLLPIGLIPSDRGMETVQVAMSDPTDLQVIDELTFLTGKRIEIAAATDTDVDLAIRHHFYGEAVADQLRGPTYLGHAPFAGHEVEFEPQPQGKEAFVVGAPVDGAIFEVVELLEDELVEEPSSGDSPPAVPLGRLALAPQQVAGDTTPFEAPTAGGVVDEPLAGGLRWQDLDSEPLGVGAVSAGTGVFAGAGAVSAGAGVVAGAGAMSAGAGVLAGTGADTALGEGPGPHFPPAGVGPVDPASGGPAVPGPLSMKERLLLETLDAVAGEDGDPLSSRAMVAGVMRLLIRKGIVTEAELVAELSRR